MLPNKSLPPTPKAPPLSYAITQTAGRAPRSAPCVGSSPFPIRPDGDRHVVRGREGGGPVYPLPMQRPLAREWDSTTRKENIVSLERRLLRKCLCVIFARTFSRLFSLLIFAGRNRRKRGEAPFVRRRRGADKEGRRGAPRYPPFPTGGGRTGGDLVQGKRGRERGGGTEKARGTIERGGEEAFLGRSPAAAVATSEEGEARPLLFPLLGLAYRNRKGAQSRPFSESPSPLCSAKSRLSRVFFFGAAISFSPFPFPRSRWATEGERKGEREGGRRGRFRHEFVTEEGGPPPPTPPCFWPHFFSAAPPPLHFPRKCS